MNHRRIPGGGFVPGNLVGDVARVDEPPARVARQALGHCPPRGGVVGAADEQGVAVGGEAGIAVSIGAGVFVPEEVDRVADGTPVGLAGQQVVGLHPVVVDQDDGGLPPL